MPFFDALAAITLRHDTPIDCQLRLIFDCEKRRLVAHVIIITAHCDTPRYAMALRRYRFCLIRRQPRHV